MEEALEKALSRAETETTAAEDGVKLGEERVQELGRLFKVACDALGRANHYRNREQDELAQAKNERAEAEEYLANFAERTREAQQEHRRVEAKVKVFYEELS